MSAALTPAEAERAEAQDIVDRRMMAAALNFGRRNMGQAAPNPSVGAIVVRKFEGVPIIVGRGVTAAGGRPHAETEALKAVGELARGATLYVTLEPCAHHSKTPPCASAIIGAGISRVVVAVEDPNELVRGKGNAMLRMAGVEVKVGVCEREALIDHAGHFRRITGGRPHVILKMAVSADGKTGLAGRRPTQISGKESSAEAHVLRATSDAIMVGSGTVLADDPRLDCRLPGMAGRSPIRVVLDGSLRIPMESNLVRTAREIPVLVIAGKDAAEDKAAALVSAGVEVMRVECGQGNKPNLREVLRELGSRGVTRLLVEGGPMISAALFDQDLVDEAIVVRAPAVLGAAAIDAVEGQRLDDLLASPKLRMIEERRLGPDRLLRLFRA